jgi:hypothetical protein
MKKKLLLIYILFFGKFLDAVSGTIPCIDSATTLLLQQKYESARSYLVQEIAASSENVDALYMALNIEQMKLIDYESYILDGSQFLNSADSLLIVIENRWNTGDKKGYVRYLFYCGNIYGAKALVMAKLSDWIRAVKFARLSEKTLRKTQAIDGSIEAAWYGIGLYDYYIGQNLSWIPFMKDKCRQGINEIDRAAKICTPFSYAAKNSLAWILVDRGEYDRADSLVSTVLLEYPENTVFLRIKARIALLKKNNAVAVDLGNKLVELSGKRNPVNWSDLLSGYQIVVAALGDLHKNKECLEVVGKALALEVPISAQTISYVVKHLRYIAEKKKLLENN